MAKKFHTHYTVSLPISCTFPVSNIFALDERNAVECAAAYYKSSKVNVGYIRQARVDVEMSCATENTAARVEDALCVSDEMIGRLGGGHMYDVVLVIYGYYVVGHIPAPTKYDAAMKIVDASNNGKFIPKTGQLQNPQIGM